jgi:lipopolysaccharide transport system ATP-binding protein
MSLALKIEQLSKIYHLGQIGTGTFYNDLKRFSAKIRGKEDPFLKIGEVNHRSSKGGNVVYSLKDINLELNQGDALGIIGKNGAGKSTLLKIISQITAPSSGQVKIKGRVASLLEVGTGFHPELTGRENIFLNGAILGMRKHEISRKLDEIIAFSGVERYIDTPVKRYSSGMYVRLAFAVAAHLESEILIIDEVLAVGDAEFQKKCLGKMGDVTSKEGRTVLFVSHNIAAVKSLCNKGLVLEDGQNKMFGDIGLSTNYYMGGSNSSNEKEFTQFGLKDIFQLNKISIQSKKSNGKEAICDSEDFELETVLDVKVQDAEKYHVTYHLYNDIGEAVFSFSHFDQFDLKQGANVLTVCFPSKLLQSGTYSLHFFFVFEKREVIYNENDIFSFTIVDGLREMGIYMGREPGTIRPQLKWENSTQL